MKTKTQENWFCEFLGYSPEAKILEYLFEIKEKAFTFNDIVKEISVNRKRAYEILRFFLDEGFIKEVEKIKNIQFYKLNIRKPEIKSLQQFFDRVFHH